MLYSTWNETKSQWDYYEAMGKLDSGVFAPRPSMPMGNRLGLAPSEAERSLPAGAKYVGSGELARGLVASRKTLGFLGDTGTLMKFAVYGAVGYVVWTMLMSEPQKKKVRRAIKGTPKDERRWKTR